jgi:hypothetical protein
LAQATNKSTGRGAHSYGEMSNAYGGPHQLFDDSWLRNSLQPVSLNLYQMPLALDDEQEDDCSQYNTLEMLCDMGLKI